MSNDGCFPEKARHAVAASPCELDRCRHPIKTWPDVADKGQCNVVQDIGCHTPGQDDAQNKVGGIIQAPHVLAYPDAFVHVSIQQHSLGKWQQVRTGNGGDFVPTQQRREDSMYLRNLLYIYRLLGSHTPVFH